MAANINYLKGVRFSVASVVLCLVAVTANAGLFEDADARNAILNLRERVEATRLESEQGLSRAAEDRASIRQSLLELHNQIETLRLELANFRGLNEKLARDMADTQLRQKDITSGVNERLRQFEPEKVVVDGHEFMVEPAEKRDFETALAVFRKGDFSAAQSVFLNFLHWALLATPNTDYSVTLSIGQLGECLGVAIGMRALGLGQRLEPVRHFVMTFVTRGLGHAGVHVGVLVGLASNG